MDYAMLAAKLAAHIRNTVRPLLGAPGAGTVTGKASSGDATFSIDNTAEDAVVEFIKQHGLNVAYYTEDGGLREFGTPEATLIIDPIDGSRGAAAGFECSVVSVAVASYGTDVRMRDVIAGCIHEIKHDRAFIAERGRGTRIIDEGRETLPQLRNTETFETAAWTMEITARPSRFIVNILSKAIDASALRGGLFILNSTAYSLTRLVNGQLAAAVDIGGRILNDMPEAREAFIKAGYGTVVGLFPYDIAAGVLIAEEAGCVVTDAYGNSLSGINLLNNSSDNILSIIATCTPGLHNRFLDVIERGLTNSSQP